MNFDKFVELESQVIDPVPWPERDRYRFWRAAHLGRIALNFSRGIHTLNAGEVVGGIAIAYVFAEHHQAEKLAYSMRDNPDMALRQFDNQAKADLMELINRQEFISPTMVYALDSDFNDGQRINFTPYVDPYSMETLFREEYFRGASPLSAGTGPRLEEFLTLDMIDEYSRAAIKEIFALD